jgi:hypothetical protein
MSRNIVIRNFLLFLGAGGVCLVYGLGTTTAQQTSPETMQVSPSSVDLQALPDTAPSRQGEVVLPRPRIPIGDEQLEKIKKDPSTVPEGRVPLGSQPQPTTATAKPLAQPIGPKNLSVIYNCTGNASTSGAPSDSHGAVGKTAYLEVTNVDIGVYSRTGCTKLLGKSLKTFFGITDSATTAFDPQAAYDPVKDRFVITAETERTNSTDQYQYFAVSKTNNAAGAYWVYKLRLSDSTGTFCKKASTDFWDYPHLGYNNSGTSGSTAKWFLTANVFPTSGAAYAAIMTIEKPPTLTGGSATLRCYGTDTFAVQFDTAPPIVRTTGNLAYFLSTGSGSGSSLKKYTIDTTANTIAGPSTIPLPASWTAPPAASQPGTTQKLDTLDGRFQSASVQIGTTLWNVHAVNVSGRARSKVYKVNATANTSVLAVFVQTSSTSFNFNPSFVTGSTSTTSPGFLTWSTTDPPAGIKPAMDMLTGPNASSTGWFVTRFVTSTSSCTSASVCRWGDYSSTTLDPLNVNQAFGVNQYLTGSSEFNWSTKIGGIQFVP